ncbi:hypothetical protein EV356DRAFT_249728 [Viridothelium virens]|uniref:Uncharacterized protein n=1 Tax=Viridothelium virens TaxID=1048519 RepID=A0A6A6H341_VIRVR|nr:hypothetical protein EV356DRAFT_249728 [Viridothelium virens]
MSGAGSGSDSGSNSGSDSGRRGRKYVAVVVIVAHHATVRPPSATLQRRCIQARTRLADRYWRCWVCWICRWRAGADNLTARGCRLGRTISIAQSAILHRTGIAVSRRACYTFWRPLVESAALASEHAEPWRALKFPPASVLAHPQASPHIHDSRIRSDFTDAGIPRLFATVAVLLLLLLLLLLLRRRRRLRLSACALFRSACSRQGRKPKQHLSLDCLDWNSSASLRHLLGGSSLRSLWRPLTV